MSDQDPRPDGPIETPPISATASVSPAGVGYDAGYSTPPEPELPPEPMVTVGQPGPRVEDESSDKLWPQFAWEGLLLVLIALGVAAFFLFGPSGGLGSSSEVAEMLAGVTPFLLFATALGLSLRVGAVNLAVPHLALLSAVLFTTMGGQPLLLVIGVVAGVMLAAGVVLSLLVTVFRAPGWAAGLLVAMAAWFLVTQREFDIFGGLVEGRSPEPLQLSEPIAWAVVAGALLLSIVGGLIGIMRPVRSTLGVCVDAVERRGRRSAGAFGLTWLALIGSCLLAGAAGYLALLPSGTNLNVAVMDANGLAPLLTGLGIVLIGGTGLRGRRGGVFGTLLAAVVVFMVTLLVEPLGGSWITNYAIPFGAVLSGLLVNWVLDLFNPVAPRPVPAAAPMPPAAAPLFVTAPQPEPFDFGAPEAAPPTKAFDFGAPEPAQQTLAVPARPEEPSTPDASRTVSLPAEPPTATDTTHEIPADANNPYLYRPPAG